MDKVNYLTEEYRIKAAKYKAYFFQKNELAAKLEKQILENTNNLRSNSMKVKAVYRTLHDMVDEEIISESEYSFCNAV